MLKKLLIIFFISLSFVLFIYACLIEPNKLDITNYSIKDDELAGIKIVFATDLHVKKHQTKKIQELVELINSYNPDLVLSSGDFVAGHTKLSTMSVDKIATLLGKIKSKYGFYTCLGNHDDWHDREFITSEFAKNGITVLHNENTKVNIKGKDVYIAGIQYKIKDIALIDKTLENTSSPIIMLTHSPDEFVKMPNNINLVLAGHTHGGQIKLPFVGAIFTASKYKDKYLNGYIEENGKRMIVSRGLGVSILPLRFNCKPELVIIEFI